MKTLYSIIILLSSCFGMKEVRSKPEKNMQQSTTSFYDIKMKAIDGKEIDFSMYKGKKVLLVNVASKCGYTPQYTELQELHQKYGDKVTVLGFPANNFGKQEPGTNEEIVQFCKKNYGVTFQMFEKISVIGDDQHPLYQWISDPEQNGWNDQRPRWNFTKYLINEDGELVKSFGSGVKPMSEEILSAINK
ncbi:MAG: glutathione peroxidase [Cytophagales bacterium]|nr:glutathione peroxidase [Cytophagales bacterium]